MHLIEKISNKFAGKISAELGYDEEKREVIAYGTHALLQLTFSLLLVIVFGLIFGVLVESLIATFAASVLRRYSGGAHATSPIICVIVGTIVAVGFGLLSKITALNNIWLVLGLTVFVIAYGMFIIKQRAPVESENKPISDRRKVKMKKESLILLVIFAVIAAGLLIAFVISNEGKYLTYAICFLLGILWQVFTLTKAGEVILGRIDGFLNKFLKFT